MSQRVHRALLPIYGQFGRPTEGAIRKLFTLLDIKPPTRRRRVRTEENIAAVSASQLGLCYSTTWKILRWELGVKPYKIQLVQELKPHDLPQPFQFGEWALAKLEEDPHFYRSSLLQNCRIWSEDYPEALQELPMHPEKITVWCGLWASGIIGPYFFKDDNGRNVTVNGERYRAMITNFFLPKMEELDFSDMWFQQDRATCHTAHETIALLRGEFGEQFISRLGPVNWPPRSCDLTPLDYFLWGHVKANVYSRVPQTFLCRRPLAMFFRVG
ncbi:unnamed protein product [Acanthoscelides obtectus]|uniref:Transposase n=1 Tax=Acanthoscelides obtectus TaxID=200917 RepID=A0A9P0KEC5_ACAOB|nr:unnamed protein product [Acanthoscelides obtectus]CAK1640989.1 hypothetical protein AOBTE_LOCUS12062 [Acanthoscelides obtectus]